MAAAGIQEARFPAPWLVADPAGAADRRGGAFVWSTYFDTVALLLARNGMRWSPMLLYPPPLYSADPLGPGGGNPTPAAYGYFADFAGAFAARYGPGGTFWAAHPGLRPQPVTDFEIWNEPNIAGGWATLSPSQAPAEYMRMYADAYRSIKLADPTARVMFGSLTPSIGAVSEGAFLAAAHAADPSQPIDEVGYHPYVVGVGRYGAVADTYALLSAFRARMDAIGLGAAPISVTELGFGETYSPWIDLTGDEAVTLTQAQRAQAMSIVAGALADSNCGVNDIEALMWGSDVIVGAGSADQARFISSDFALATAQNRLLPIGVAYAAAIRADHTGLPAAICG
jgi:hypothetical protein